VRAELRLILHQKFRDWQKGTYLWEFLCCSIILKFYIGFSILWNEDNWMQVHVCKCHRICAGILLKIWFCVASKAGRKRTESDVLRHIQSDRTNKLDFHFW